MDDNRELYNRSYDLQAYLSLKKFDIIGVTMDFKPTDGVPVIETVNGVFIMHAMNLPAGWIPFAFCALENGFVGWLHPALITLVSRREQSGDTNEAQINKVIALIGNVSDEIDKLISILKMLNTELGILMKS